MAKVVKVGKKFGVAHEGNSESKTIKKELEYRGVTTEETIIPLYQSRYSGEKEVGVNNRHGKETANILAVGYRQGIHHANIGCRDIAAFDKAIQQSKPCPYH